MDTQEPSSHGKSTTPCPRVRSPTPLGGGAEGRPHVDVIDLRGVCNCDRPTARPDLTAITAKPPTAALMLLSYNAQDSATPSRLSLFNPFVLQVSMFAPLNALRFAKINIKRENFYYKFFKQIVSTKYNLGKNVGRPSLPPNWLED